MASNLIYNILKGKNTLKPELETTNKSSDQLDKSVKGIGGSLAGVLSVAKRLGPAIAAIGVGLGLRASVKEAQELEAALIGLSSVAASTGQDVNFIREQAKDLAADGLIPLTEVSNSLKNLLASGLDGQEAVKTFKALRDAASFNRQGTLELGQAIEGATQGIKNQNSILVDNAGITKNLSVLQKEYAESIGTTVGRLTEQQKQQAIYNGIIREAAIFQGDYNKLQQTFSGAASEAGGQLKFLAASIGEIVTRNPLLIKLTSDLANVFLRLRGFIEDNTPAIRQFINNGIVFAVDAFGALVSAASIAAQVLNGIITTVGLVASGYAEFARVVFTTFQPLQDVYKTLGQGVLFIADSVLTAIQSITSAFSGTALGEGLLERFGLSPESISQVNGSIDSLKEKMLGLSNDVANSDLAETFEGVRDSINGAILFSDERLEELQAGFDSVKESTNQFGQELNEISAKNDEARVEQAQKTSKAVIENKKKETNFLKAFVTDFQSFEEASNKQRIQNLRSTLGTIGSLTSQSNKTLFAIGKAAAISGATIDGIAAVQKALASAPPPFNFALASLVGVATAANIAKIASQKPPSFQNGGIVQGNTSSGDNVNVNANAGEAILTREQQSNLFNQLNGRNTIENEVEASQNMPIIVQIDGREIARAVREQVRQGFRLA
jgi:hypothetical protein